MLRLCFGNFVLDFEFSSFLLLFYGCYFHSSSSDANDNRVGNVLGRFPFRSANNSNCYNMRNICTKTDLWHCWMTNMSSIVSRMYMKRFSKLLRTQYRMFQRLWHRVSRPLESGSINGDKITLQKGVLRAVGAKIFQLESPNYILLADLKDFTIEVWYFQNLVK